MVNQKVRKRKYLSWVYGVDRKICHSGSLLGITKQENCKVYHSQEGMVELLIDYSKFSTDKINLDISQSGTRKFTLRYQLFVIIGVEM